VCREPDYAAANAAGFCLNKPAGFALEWAAFWAHKAGEYAGAGGDEPDLLAAIEARIAAGEEAEATS
jgi:hypothetical protein